MEWFHQTSEDARAAILRDGFDVGKCKVARFGTGIYFSDQLDFGFFGEAVVRAVVHGRICELTHREICQTLFPEFNLEEDEEGILELKEYVLNLGYQAVSIRYSDGSRELVVYDASIVSVLY